MNTESVPAIAKSQQTVSITDYLGPAPLIDGENPEAYQQILERITATVKPSDPLEEIWLRDVVDLAWEAVRWRRCAAGVITGRMRDHMLQLLHPLVGSREAARLSDGYSRGDVAARTRIKEVLVKVGLSMEAMAANAATLRHPDLLRLDLFERLAAQAEARRNVALKEISRHREGFADALRNAGDEIQDGEFDEIAGGGDEGAKAQV
jgi:hypothetical protein